MRERPAPLFCEEMLAAIKDGRKTQTRRLKKSDKPRYAVGDRLWLREGHCLCLCQEQCLEHIAYRGTDVLPPRSRWRPSQFMPKWAARRWLIVTDVRAERLHEISERDVIAEGVKYVRHCSSMGGFDVRFSEYIAAGKSFDRPRAAFAHLWDSIYGKDPAKCWAANPMVWAYTFKKEEGWK